MAGINGMRPRRFLPINAAACMIWALLVGIGAYLAGPRIEDLLGSLGTAGLILLAVVAVGAWIASRVRRQRKTGRLARTTPPE